MHLSIFGIHLFIRFILEEKFFDLLLKFGRFLFYTTIAHCFTAGGMSFYVSSIKSNMAKLYQPCLLAKAKHLNKQSGKSVEMTLTKVSNGYRKIQEGNFS